MVAQDMPAAQPAEEIIRGCSSVGERTARIRKVEGSTPFISTR